MENKEKFPYQLDFGSVVDFVDGRFLLVIKDDYWNEDQIALLKAPVDLTFSYTNGLAIFVVEGGPVDSSDFYFNIQECDEKDSLLSKDQLTVELMLIDAMDNVCWKKRKELSIKDSAPILNSLKEQAKIEFMPGEYEVNAEGLQSAYEPYELKKFAKAGLKL